MMYDPPKPDHGVHISVQGGTFSHKRNLHLKREKKSQYQREDDLCSVEFPDNLDEGTTSKKTPRKRSRLHKKYMRSKRNFMRKLSTLESEPTFFSSLIMDKKSYKKLGVDVDVNIFMKVFDKFKRCLRNKYEDGWFIWKIEWSAKSFLHVHIIGNPENGESFEITEAYIKDKWNFYCKHEEKMDSNFQSAVTLKYKSEGAKSYFFKKSKRNEDKMCIKILGGLNIYGQIRGKNIKYTYKEEFYITEFEYEMLISHIIRKLKKDGKKKEQ